MAFSLTTRTPRRNSSSGSPGSQLEKFRGEEAAPFSGRPAGRLAGSASVERSSSERSPMTEEVDKDVLKKYEVAQKVNAGSEPQRLALHVLQSACKKRWPDGQIAC